MRTNFDISLQVYKIVNTTAVKALLNGTIYRERRKQYNTGDTFLRDIAIVPLTVNGEYIQQGMVMVNCYCPDLSNGTPDIDTLETIATAVISEFENYVQDPAKDFFHVEVAAPGGVMQDKQGESYFNLRINFSYEQ